MLNSIVKYFVILGLISVMVGCVTTQDGAIARKSNPEEAAEKFVQLGLEYIKLNDYAKARSRLNKALENDSDNAPANAALGLIYHREDEPELAEQHFERSIDSDPSYTPGRTYYGAFLFSEARFKDALVQFEIASRDVEYRSRDQIFVNIAKCHLQLDDRSKAIKAYEKALRLDVVNVLALQGIVEVFMASEEHGKAEKAYRRSVSFMQKRGIKRPASVLLLGIKIYQSLGDEAKVSSLEKELASNYPSSTDNKNDQQTTEG